MLDVRGFWAEMFQVVLPQLWQAINNLFANW